MLIIAGALLSLFGWLWTVVRGFEVGIVCALLNFFFPPLAQIIYCIYERRLRQPAFVMFLGWALGIYASWYPMHHFMQQQMHSLGHGIAV